MTVNDHASHAQIDQAGRAIAILAAAWPGTFIPPDMADNWAEQLRQIPGNAYVPAAETIVRNGTPRDSFPTLHRFLETAQAEARGLAGRQAPRECDDCGGDLLVLVLEPNPPHRHRQTARPCANCNPEAYEAWRSGKLRPSQARPKAYGADREVNQQGLADALATLGSRQRRR